MLMRLPSNRIVRVLGAILMVLVVYFRLPQLHSLGNAMRSSSHDLIDDINNNTLGFQQIFVVGLPSRTDRRDGIYLQAALSNLSVEFIDGVNGKDIPDKAIPVTSDHEPMNSASLGSWRAHMNAIQEVVRRNLTSALILEDDVDWDIRIRRQLHDFALSTHALTQPLKGSPGYYADPTYPTPSAKSPGKIPDIPFDHLPNTEPPSVSPYGDNWDLLWVGNCGFHFPFEDNKKIPKGRVIHSNDETVAQKRYLWALNIPFTLKEKYPQHTRAVHHVQEGVCTLGYAVTQRSAQKLLYEVGLKDVSAAFDLLLRYFCEGEEGRRYHNCLAIQPSLFHHHRTPGPISAESDMEDHGDGFREKGYTDMVRWSVRLNADALLEGGNESDFEDQYPDTDGD
ncbi:glycosyltransferase family 25 protein, partial [Xylariaceae sp. FL0662B]